MGAGFVAAVGDAARRLLQQRKRMVFSVVFGVVFLWYTSCQLQNACRFFFFFFFLSLFIYFPYIEWSGLFCCGVVPGTLAFHLLYL